MARSEPWFCLASRALIRTMLCHMVSFPSDAPLQRREVSMTGAYAYTPDIWPPLVAAVFLAAIGLYAWRRRAARRRRSSRCRRFPSCYCWGLRSRPPPSACDEDRLV